MGNIEKGMFISKDLTAIVASAPIINYKVLATEVEGLLGKGVLAYCYDTKKVDHILYEKVYHFFHIITDSKISELDTLTPEMEAEEIQKFYAKRATIPSIHQG
jgi:hypothetical protein